MNESQAVTYKTLVKDASYGEAGPDERTIAAYLDLFNRLKLTEDLCGWEPPMRSKARVRVRPKRYFCDPSLAAALLGATPERLLGDMQTLGMLFENLVLRDVRVFLNSIDHQLDLVRAAGVSASRDRQETDRRDRPDPSASRSPTHPQPDSTPGCGFCAWRSRKELHGMCISYNMISDIAFS